MDLLATDVLLVIDVQNDFCPGGALAVKHGDEIVPAINRLRRRFAHVVVTQDWHPAGHVSFASSHAGRQPFERVETAEGGETLWPNHCVQGSWGAALHAGLELQQVELVLRKGFRREMDSYSAFLENDHRTPTGLAGYLRERGLRRVFVCGLAYDFCVRFSAVDGRAMGFDMVMVEDATRAVFPKSVGATDEALEAAGVVRVMAGAL